MSTPFTDYTKPTETTSRVAQLHNYIQHLRGGGTEWETCFDMLGAECRALAAEVDTRDEVIGKLLEMLFNEIPKFIKPNLEEVTKMIEAENRYNLAKKIAEGRDNG